MLDLIWVKVAYLLFIFVLAYLHMRYVHRPPLRWTRRGIVLQLVGDLVGFGATWAMLAHLGRLEGWLRTFLVVHLVVHGASIFWAVFHWPSLEEHMRLFQARKLHPVFAAAEFLYEQSDTALYLMMMAFVGATLPASFVIPGIMIASAFVAAFLPTAGFARAPAEQAEPARSGSSPDPAR